MKQKKLFDEINEIIKCNIIPIIPTTQEEKNTEDNFLHICLMIFYQM